MILLILTIIQGKATIPASLRNAQVENIYILFTVDGLAFKNLLMNGNLSNPEKALIENIIRQISASR